MLESSGPSSQDPGQLKGRRRTKVICTIGPATSSFNGLKKLYEAGMNVVRINMSHSDHANARKIIGWIKTLNRQIESPIPILLDTQGPEIRTGELEHPMQLNEGEIVRLTVRDVCLSVRDVRPSARPCVRVAHAIVSCKTVGTPHTKSVTN